MSEQERSGNSAQGGIETLPVLRVEQADRSQFVQCWSALYLYLGDDSLYDENIGRSLTAERVRKLYLWKNGVRLAAKKREAVEANFVGRIGEARDLPKDTSPEEFLRTFSSGGAIWRIFWLHLWQPQVYPIYDQHVHRAMVSIRRLDLPDLRSVADRRKIQFYLTHYLPFHAEFNGLDLRSVDRALWTFGKYLSRYPLVRVPGGARA